MPTISIKFFSNQPNDHIAHPWSKFKCKQKHAFNHVITQPWTKFPNLTYMYCILSSIFWNFFCQSKFMWLAVSLNCNLFPKQLKWPRTTFCQAYNFKNSSIIQVHFFLKFKIFLLLILRHLLFWYPFLKINLFSLSSVEFKLGLAE